MSLLLLLLLTFFSCNTSSKIPKPRDNDTSWATIAKLYRIGRFYSSHANSADNKNLERMDRKIDDVKENFVNLMEDVRDIKKTIEIYHGPQNPKGNSPTGQNSGVTV